MERKKRGERRRERDEEGMREREIDGGVSEWEKEGDWKRERDRERERRVKQMCQNCKPTMNMNSLWDQMKQKYLIIYHLSRIIIWKIYIP